jgi:NADH-quinone oxidoreductase subunit N
MFIDCLLWAPEIQMLFGLLGLLWYGTHYSSIIVSEKSLEIIKNSTEYNFNNIKDDNSYTYSYDNKIRTLTSLASLPLHQVGVESVENIISSNTTLFVNKSKSSKIEESEIQKFINQIFHKKPFFNSNIISYSGPFSLVQHLLYWCAIWCFLSAIQVWSVPLNVIQFSGVFIRDYWTQSISLALMIFALVYLLVSAQWTIQAKNIHLEYSLLVLLALFGQHLLCMSTDLMSLYVSLELQSFCFVILCSLNYQSLYSIEAGMKYFLLSAFSSGLFLLGISLIYWTTGLTNCANLDELLQTTDLKENIVFLIGVWLVSLTLLWKLAAAPLHLWAADVYQGAWSSVTLLLSTLPKLAILSFWLYQWHPIWSKTFGNIMIWFSGLSMLVGAVGAMGQVHLKRLMAFSSIGHMGILLMPLCTTEGSSSALLSHLFIYFCTSLITWGLIMWPFLRRAGIFPANSNSSTSTPQYLWDFSLLWKTKPIGAWAWAIAMMSLAGLPPVAGFLGKLGIFWWSLNAHQYPLLAVALLSTLISTVYYLRLIRIMYLDKPSQWSHFHKLSDIPAYLISISLILLLILLWYSSPLVLATHLISLA